MHEVYGSGDPATLKLAIALEELGLEYRFHGLNLNALDQWHMPHSERAKNGEVPLLLHEGRVMADATIALMYLAEADGTARLLPADPLLRYDVLAVNDVLDGALLHAVNLLGWTRQTDAPTRTAYYANRAKVSARKEPAGWSAVWNDAEEDKLTRAREKVHGGVARLEALLGGRQYLVGESFTIADINAFSLIEGLDVLPSSLAEWVAGLRRRAAVRRPLSNPGRAETHAVFAPPH